MVDTFNGDGWDPEVSNNGWVYQRQRVNLGRHSVHHAGKLIVAIDGGCLNNGKPNATAAIGVFFGKGNSHNRKEMLVEDPDITWTSQRAELWAACRALRIVTGFTVKSCKHCSPPLRMSLDSVIFKSDSEYVVKGITKFYSQWRQHDWKNSSGNPIANKDLWDHLHWRVTRLQKFGIHVSYWPVRREQNQEADQLANEALLNQIPALYPYPNSLKRKREREDGAFAIGPILVQVDTSTTSDPVWKHHHALAHLDLDMFKRTLRFYSHINDITEADVQAKIDSNECCAACRAREATSLGRDGRDDEPVAKRARVEVTASSLANAPEMEPMVDSPSPGGLPFARDFEFSFERPSNVIF